MPPPTAFSVSPVFRRPKATNRARGFTVIEVLVVLALSTTLLVALMGVTTVFSQYQQTMLDKFPDSAWKNRLEEQLRSDIINSRQYKTNATSLELVGYAGRDVATGNSTLAASSIRYWIEDVDGSAWMVRQQSQRGPGDHIVSSRELVCQGISAIQLERLEMERLLSGARPRQSPEMLVFARIPDRLVIRLFQTPAQTSQGETPAFPKASSIERQRGSVNDPNSNQPSGFAPWIFRVVAR